jgi:hypothetical protein
MPDTYSNIIAATAVQLRRDDEGEPVAVFGDRSVSIGQILSVYPISNKDHFISLRDHDGKEIGIVEQAHELDIESRRVVKEELERSYFLPKIEDILSVEDDLNIITWKVYTDKGFRVFEVRNPRQNVRRVGHGRYIIKDVDGNRYEIPRLGILGPKSQNMIREFV